jgi:hypothetical protein
MVVRTMGAAVNVKGASSAYSLTAIVVERHGTTALATSINSYRIITFPDKLLIKNV